MSEKTVYAVIVSGVHFTLTEGLIQSDTPDRNLFASSLLGDFAEAQSRKLEVDRDVPTFVFVLDHLKGYPILPLGRAADGDEARVLRYLQADAEHYGLVRLAALVKAEIRKGSTAKKQDTQAVIVRRDLGNQLSVLAASAEKRLDSIEKLKLRPVNIWVRHDVQVHLSAIRQDLKDIQACNLPGV